MFVCALSYFTTPGILAGGTNKGKVAMWKHVVTKPQQRKLEGQEKWEFQSPAVLEGETQLSQIQVRKECERYRRPNGYSTLDFASKHIIQVLARVLCLVSLEKTLYSHSLSLHSCV